MRTLAKENYILEERIEEDDINNIANNVNAMFASPLAGEDIVAGNPCYIEDGSTWFEKFVQGNGSVPSTSFSIYGANVAGQTFTTKRSPYGSIVLTEFRIFLTKDGTPPNDLNLDIYAVDASDNPTGASLATSTVSAASAKNNGYTDFAFNLSLAANTKYIAVLSLPSGVGTANAVRWWTLVGGSSVPMIDGEFSFNSGSWSVGYAQWAKFQIKYSYVYGTAGRLYISRADVPNRARFRMIALESKSAGNACLCQLANVANGLSGLTAGMDYFVEDNLRTIAEQNTVNNQEEQVYSANWAAQTFDTDADTEYISGARLTFKRNNTPTGAFTISIRATSGDLPTGADLVSKTFQNFARRFDTSGQKEIDFEFDTPVAVSPSTRYALVIRNAAGDASNYLIARSANSDAYANGRLCTSTNSGSSWTGQTRDLVFNIFGHSAEGIRTTQGTYKTRVGEALSATEMMIDKKIFAAVIEGNIVEHLLIPNSTTYEVGRHKLPFVPSKVHGFLEAYTTGGNPIGRAMIDWIPNDNYTLVMYGYSAAVVGAERSVGEILEEDMNWHNSSANAKLGVSIVNRELIFSVINDTGGTIDLAAAQYKLFLEA